DGCLTGWDWDDGHGAMQWQDAHIRQEAQLPQDVDQFHMAGHDLLGLPVHEVVEDAVPGWRGWTIDRDEDPLPPRLLQLRDERDDLSGEIGDVIHQRDRPHWWVYGEPIARDDAGVGDPRLGRVGGKACAHGD